jgi:IMP dehydrogenase
VEALKEVAGSLDRVLAQVIGGIQSGMGYVGARTLAELRAKARYLPHCGHRDRSTSASSV